MGNIGAKPRQRTEDLVVRTLGEETLVLDRRTETAHSLPAEVTRVWDACTGSNTLAEIAAAAGIDEPAAASAVGQLVELDLLDAPAGIDRRDLMRRSALVGAGAVTIAGITSVVGPMPFAAASPDPGIEFTVAPGRCNGTVGNFPAGSILLTGFTHGTGPATVTIAVVSPTTVSVAPSSFMVALDSSGSGSNGTTVTFTGAGPASSTAPPIEVMVTVTRTGFNSGPLAVTVPNPCNTGAGGSSVDSPQQPAAGSASPSAAPSPTGSSPVAGTSPQSTTSSTSSPSASP